MILTHRPLLLARLRRGNRPGRDPVADEADRIRSDQSIFACIGAAMSIVELIDDIIEAGQLYRAYWV